MRRLPLAAALVVAATFVLPATASAGRALTPECPVLLCAGVSADGARVVFQFSEELTPGMNRPQVYEWSGGRVRPLVPIPKGARKTAAIGIHQVSADARHVFVETVLGLVPEDVDGGFPDIYDVGGGAPTLISTGPLDLQRGGGSLVSFAGASVDGARAFFYSVMAPQLPGDSGSCWFVYERAGGITSPVVSGPKPQEPLPPNLCHDDKFGGISDDGGRVFFTTERQLIEEDDGGEDIYQRLGGVLSVLTTYPEPSPDRPGSGNCIDRPMFADSSADGGTILFTTNTPVSPEDTDAGFDVYKRLPDGGYTLVSRGTDGGAGCGGFGGDRPVALSADGSTAIFETRARLSASDTDSSNDVYRAQDGAPPLLLSTGPTDPGGDEQSQVFPDWVTDVSADARAVAFETKAPLATEDRDRSMDVYVSVDGVTRLASTGPLSLNSGAAAELRGISADGQTVAFATKARLTRSDLDKDRDVYLRRVARKQTRLVSAEAIAPEMKVAARGPLLGSGIARVGVGCPKAETSGPCRGSVTLMQGRVRLGRSTFQVAAGRRRPIAVRVRRSFSPLGPVTVLARVRGADRLGNSRATERRVRLIPRGRGGR